MYRHCVFCSTDLGTNEVLEEFPVGRSVAFDAWRGRLWAVCPRCARWNLAPIEERWEAVEAADRLFTDTRIRVQSENVGLAKMRDGTRLIRIGEALPGELAAWRYGRQLVQRRRQYLLVGGASALGGLALAGGIAALTASGAFISIFSSLYSTWQQKQLQKVIHRVPAGASPTGQPLEIRRWHAQAGILEAAEEGGGIRLHLPDVNREKPKLSGWGKTRYSGETVVLDDAPARAVLARAMVHVNAKGASRNNLQHAVGLLSDAGTAEAFLRQTAGTGRSLAKREDRPDQALATPTALALEMALHEEGERRALEGELSALTVAWREAEEIAEIADALPFDPLERLRGKW